MYIIEPVYNLKSIPRRALSSMVSQMFGDASYRIVYNNLIIFANGADHAPCSVLCTGFVFNHNGEYFLCTSDAINYLVDEGEQLCIRGTGGTEMMIVETCYRGRGQTKFSVTCHFSPDDNDDLSMVLA